MRRLLLCFALTMLSFGVASANITTDNPDTKTLDSLDVLPSFQGQGIESFVYWVMTNVEYPTEAIEAGVEGRVLVSFVIYPDGKMRDYEVIETPTIPLSTAVIDVLERANDLENGWTPGMIAGNPVKVSFTLPVNFAMPK